MEGFLHGLIGKDYTDLEACLKDVRLLEEYTLLAIKDLESETFDGIKQGLKELSMIV